MPPLEELTPSARWLGRYRLLARVGRGGMAEVWRAEVVGPHEFARVIALKRLLPELSDDPEFARMFIAEARLSARLRHGNVVQVYELGEADGTLFLAMEYVHGRNLSLLLRALDGSGAPAGQAAYVARELCRALAHAHNACDDDGKPLHIVHRDVSPANVMLGYDGGVKLVDFGIAKALAAASDERTRTGILKGKLGYMAPELLSGERGLVIDHRVDQFAVGVVLHELITGRRLFKAATPAERERERVTPPSLLRKDVPKALEQICLRALELDRERRFADCEEMGRALEEVVHELTWGAEPARQLLLRSVPERDGGDGPPTILEKHRSKRRLSWGAAWWMGAAVVVAGGVWWAVGAHRSAPVALAPIEVAPPAVAPLAVAPVGLATPPEPRRPPVSAPAPSTPPQSERSRHPAAPSAQRRAAPVAPGEEKRLKRGGVVDPFANEERAHP